MATSRPAGAGAAGPRPRTPATDGVDLAGAEGHVTALEPVPKEQGRFALSIDGRRVATLDAEVIVKARLKVGMAVNGPALLEVVRQDQQKRAWDQAVLVLGCAPRTRREVERKLARSFPPEAVETALDRLTAGGWLDDAAYAQQYCQSHPSLGAVRLRQELARRGVAREVAEAALQEAQSGTDPALEARGQASRRLARMPGTDRASAQRKLSAFLVRRGFNFETVSRALRPLLDELPAPPRPPAGRSRWGRRKSEEESE